MAKDKNVIMAGNTGTQLPFADDFKNPKAKGWSYRKIYKMVQLYNTYSTTEFTGLVSHYGIQNYLWQTTDSTGKQIVPFETAQFTGDSWG